MLNPTFPPTGKLLATLAAVRSAGEPAEGEGGHGGVPHMEAHREFRVSSSGGSTLSVLYVISASM